MARSTPELGSTKIRGWEEAGELDCERAFLWAVCEDGTTARQALQLGQSWPDDAHRDRRSSAREKKKGQLKGRCESGRSFVSAARGATQNRTTSELW